MATARRRKCLACHYGDGFHEEHLCEMSSSTPLHSQEQSEVAGVEELNPEILALKEEPSWNTTFQTPIEGRQNLDPNENVISVHNQVLQQF